MKDSVDEAIIKIERAANGMSGATMMADVPYASRRRKDIGFAAEHLRATGINVDGLLAKADKLLEACRQRNINGAVQLNIEICEILAPLCD